MIEETLTLIPGPTPVDPRVRMDVVCRWLRRGAIHSYRLFRVHKHRGST